MPDSSLYESMASHPDTGPIMELLGLVEPVDEFSKALCLVRDCFSPNNTLRSLSRKQLRALLGERINLMNAFESAVVRAANEYGSVSTFAAAVRLMPCEELVAMQESYNAQVCKLMGRT